MFRNHLKIAIRSLVKDRSTSFINLFGLTVGLTCCLLIGLYIWNELSFDKFHSKAENIYRVNRQFFNKDGTEMLHLGHVAPPFGPLLENDFPDIQAVTRMLQYNFTVQNGEVIYDEENSFVAEPAIFEIFDINIKEGNINSLDEPFTVMLSEEIAEKYFGAENPVGETIKVNGDIDVEVTGVFEAFPFNSHFHPELLYSFSTLHDDNIYGREGLRTNWGNNSFSTYILLPDGYPAESLEEKFPAFVDKVMAGVFGELQPSKVSRLSLTPLTDIHLHSHLDTEIEENGDMRRVQIFSIIAILVLIIACINYMNLATARSANRAKEIGVRKVVGARRETIVGQFLSEALVLSIWATLFAIMLSQIALPFLNDILGQELQITSTMMGVLPLILLVVAIITGLIAGLYPALYLSGMKPIRVLKNNIQRKKNSGGVGLRKVLVVGQFAISAMLIIATIVVYNQLDYMQKKDLGFDKDHVLTIPYYAALAPQYDSFRNRLLANSSILNMGRSSRVPSGRLLDSAGPARLLSGTDTLSSSGVSLKDLRVDHRFIDTYGMELIAGRNYKSDYGNDKTNAFVINENAAGIIGFENAEDAVNERILYDNREGRIVGVVKDFNFESLHQGIQPMIFKIPFDSSHYNSVSIKVDGENMTAAISEVEKMWKEYLPQFPFDYQFVDDRFGRLYENEQRQSKVFIGFALLAILVACLGLFGLTAFVARQRVKEIGIRKVLGATTGSIATMLSKDFLKPVLISLFIAAPLAYYFMDKWLQDFAYRVEINWWVFVLAGLVAVIVAFTTVSFQSVRAALANPVDSLRGE